MCAKPPCGWSPPMTILPPGAMATLQAADRERAGQVDDAHGAAVAEARVEGAVGVEPRHEEAAARAERPKARAVVAGDDDLAIRLDCDRVRDPAGDGCGDAAGAEAARELASRRELGGDHVAAGLPDGDRAAVGEGGDAVELGADWGARRRRSRSSCRARRRRRRSTGPRPRRARPPRRRARRGGGSTESPVGDDDALLRLPRQLVARAGREDPPAAADRQGVGARGQGGAERRGARRAALDRLAVRVERPEADLGEAGVLVEAAKDGDPVARDGDAVRAG